MLVPDFPLRTRRLLLRPYGEGDLDFLLDLESDPDVARYVPWSPRDVDGVRASLAAKVHQTALREEGDDLTLLLSLGASGERVGDVQLSWTSRASRQGEVGFVLHPRSTGRGYATEAAGLMLELGFGELGLHRICGRVDERNTASARVLQRLGMRKEACLREAVHRKGEWVDEAVHAVLAAEWRARVSGAAR